MKDTSNQFKVIVKNKREENKRLIDLRIKLIQDLKEKEIKIKELIHSKDVLLYSLNEKNSLIENIEKKCETLSNESARLIEINLDKK